MEDGTRMNANTPDIVRMTLGVLCIGLMIVASL